MKDRLTKERRSWNMSRIRSKNTTPEMRVRSLLHRMGYRFRLHVRIPIQVGRAAPRPPHPGPQQNGARGATRPTFTRPDIVLPKHKTAIFVHGCFWHRHQDCKNCTTPTNHREWWLAKLNGNAARDKLHQTALKQLGWKVIVIWECKVESATGLERLVWRLATGAETPRD